MKWFFPIALIALGGCATLPGNGAGGRSISGALSHAEQTCSDIIAANGGILKFCQNERTLEIYESGVNSRTAVAQTRLVDDPDVLRGLQTELSLRPELAGSRRLVANSCAVGDRRYLTISVETLKRILHGRGERIAFLDGDPSMTGSIAPPEPRMLDPR